MCHSAALRDSVWYVVMVVSLGLAACGGGSGDQPSTADGGGSPSDGGGGAIVTKKDASGTIALPTLVPFVPPDANVIIGRVVDPDGNGVEGASVTYAGGGKGTTDYDGFYYIANVAPAERIVLTFSAAGYVDTTGVGSMVANGKATVNAVMRVRAAGQLLDGVAGGSATFGHGVVTIPPASLMDSVGNPYQGSAMLHVTPVDIQDESVRQAPGDFSATTATGLPTRLETFGMGTYEVRDSLGNPLQIAAGAQVGVEMMLPADTTLVAGETVPAWHFDKQTGAWLEEGTGVVGPASTDPTRLSFKLNVGHFSDWNCDKPYETTCVSGLITSACDGTPIAADVRAGGLDYNGNSQTHAPAGGQYCIPVKKGSRVRITAASGYGANRVVTSVDVQSGDAVSQCPGPCTVQNIVLPCTPKDNNVDCGDDAFAGCRSCLQGRVVDSDGNPVPALLKVKTGVNSLTAVTDASGRYCTPAALGTLTTIVASGGGGSGTAVVTATTPGACPVCEQVADIVISESQSTASDIDFSMCPTVLGGVTMTGLRANGAAPGFGTLNAAWLFASTPSSAGNPYVLAFDFVSSGNIGGIFAPQANLQLELPVAPTVPGTYEVKTVDDGLYRIRGQAVSSNGAPVGLSSETYQLETYDAAVGSGWIKLDNGFANAGDRVKGSLAVNFAAECAAPQASLNIQASFDSILRDSSGLTPIGTDPASLEIWECSLFDLMSWATAVNAQGMSTGAVQVAVDGVPLTGTDPVSLSRYSWSTDRLQITYYGDTGSFSATVDHPVSGANPVASASLYLDNNSDCYLTMSAGTVTLPSFGGADTTRWLTGSLVVDFAASPLSSGTTCPAVKATGQFGVPVCAGD
jgi:hypothetical protein